MKLRDGQCRKCLSMGYCYFPEDCGREIESATTTATTLDIEPDLS